MFKRAWCQIPIWSNHLTYIEMKIFKVFSLIWWHWWTPAFVTPTIDQLITMLMEMGYIFEKDKEKNISRIKKACLPSQWHFLIFVITRCLLKSVGGGSRGITNLWTIMYSLYYDVKVEYASIIWENFLTNLPASKNYFKVDHTLWWSTIIHDTITNALQSSGGILDGKIPTFLSMTPYKILAIS